MKTYNAEDVDRLVEERGDDDAYNLFMEAMPKHTAKLNALDKRIAKVLAEIRKVFPDAEYYTASGGFTLVLGNTHEGHGLTAQPQRSAWSGVNAVIGDGDW